MRRFITASIFVLSGLAMAEPKPLTAEEQGYGEAFARGAAAAKTKDLKGAAQGYRVALAGLGPSGKPAVSTPVLVSWGNEGPEAGEADGTLTDKFLPNGSLVLVKKVIAAGTLLHEPPRAQGAQNLVAPTLYPVTELRPVEAGGH